MIFTKISQAYTKFIVHSLAHQMASKKSIDKTAKLLDLLDKQINKSKEENCRHTPSELEECEI
jgi:hypothetical protein